MFYMSYKDIWRWKMNVARVMGNSLDASYIQDLIQAFDENDDERVKAMTAWAIGHIGGQKARSALEAFQHLYSLAHHCCKIIVATAMPRVLWPRPFGCTSQPWKSSLFNRV